MRFYLNLPGPFSVGTNMPNPLDEPTEHEIYQHHKQYHTIPSFPWLSVGFSIFLIAALISEPPMGLVFLFILGWLPVWRITRYVKLVRNNSRWWNENKPR